MFGGIQSANRPQVFWFPEGTLRGGSIVKQGWYYYNGLFDLDCPSGNYWTGPFTDEYTAISNLDLENMP